MYTRQNFLENQINLIEMKQFIISVEFDDSAKFNFHPGILHSSERQTGQSPAGCWP